ncbi:MAG: hypothetical protein Q8O32_01855 [bacterium]|nr:hypothetical protein [bacterium]
MNFGIIGGTGMEMLFSQISSSAEAKSIETPYGGPVNYLSFDYQGHKIFFLDRHNNSGRFLLPHQLNRQAYMYVLGQICHCDAILASSAVGAIRLGNWFKVGDLVIPTEAINYVQEAYTFANYSNSSPIFHRPLDYPFCPHLCEALRGEDSMPVMRFVLANSITGPAFETRWQMKIRVRDGVHLVGMPTAYPEAVLAGELSIPYGLVCGVSNFAPATDDGSTVTEVMTNLVPQMAKCLFGAVNFLIQKGNHDSQCPCRKGRGHSVFAIPS